MSEPERRVVYVIEQTPKNTEDWKNFETFPEKDCAVRRMQFFRDTRLGLFWEFRLVQIEEVRTVME